jgi:hypothetical protein
MSSTLQSHALAVARAARSARRNPADELAKTRLASARRDLNEQNIAEAVRKAVDAAPPITPDAAARLSVLLFSNAA